MHKLKSISKTILAIFVLLLLVWLFTKPSLAATLSLTPNNQSVTLNVPFTVSLKLDTKSEKTTATDVVINFDPAILEVSNVEFAQPPLYPTNTKILDNTNGKIRITSTQDNAVNSYLGAETLATLTVRAKSVGTGTLVFTCETGKTNDSNVFKQGTSQDILECGNLGNGTYTIGTTGAPAAIATATIRPTLPTSGNIGPTGLMVVGGAVLLGVGALLVLIL